MFVAAFDGLGGSAPAAMWHRRGWKKTGNSVVVHLVEQRQQPVVMPSLLPATITKYGGEASGFVDGTVM